jgi:hypothetical protein
MKKIFTLALIIFVKTAFCQTDILARRFPNETIGETYILFDKHSFVDYYNGLFKTDDKDENHIKFTDYKGSKLKLVQIDHVKSSSEKDIGRFVDSAGNQFSSAIAHSRFYSMVPQSELENAQKIYAGKFVWTNPSVVPSPVRIGGITQTKVTRFKKYKVVNVSLHFQVDAPIRLDMEAADGSKLSIAASLTGTNTNYGSDEVFLLRNLLFTQDPKTLYHFTPQTWANIAAEYLVPGMDADAVELILGKPKSRNNSSNAGKYAVDQWVYPTEYIYFEGGKYKSRNSKL